MEMACAVLDLSDGCLMVEAVEASGHTKGLDSGSQGCMVFPSTLDVDFP